MIYKQLVSKKIGASGCYFLSLVNIAEKILNREIDVISLFDLCLKNKWLNDECYMNNPAAMLSYLLNKKVDIRKEFDLAYKVKPNEYEISCYEYNATGTTFYHFVVTDGERVLYDPFGGSRTVRNGKQVSKRIIAIL